MHGHGCLKCWCSGSSECQPQTLHRAALLPQQPLSCQSSGPGRSSQLRPRPRPQQLAASRAGAARICQGWQRYNLLEHHHRRHPTVDAMA
jgi:hypothetical protein